VNIVLRPTVLVVLALIFPASAFGAPSAGQPFPSNLYTVADPSQKTGLHVRKAVGRRDRVARRPILLHLLGKPGILAGVVTARGDLEPREVMVPAVRMRLGRLGAREVAVDEPEAGAVAFRR
jgi:hypothetical protein